MSPVWFVWLCEDNILNQCKIKYSFSVGKYCYIQTS